MLLNPLPNEPRDLFSESDKENNEFPLEHQRLFSWVSSLPYKNCALVSEIDDFRNGLVFSEILVDIIPENKDFLKQIETSELNYNSCLSNLSIFFTEMKSKLEVPDYMDEYTPEDLFENDQKLIILLAFLYRCKQSSSNLISHRSKPPLTTKSNPKTGKPPLGPSLQSAIIRPSNFNNNGSNSSATMDISHGKMNNLYSKTEEKNAIINKTGVAEDKYSNLYNKNIVSEEKKKGLSNNTGFSEEDTRDLNLYNKKLSTPEEKPPNFNKTTLLNERTKNLYNKIDEKVTYADNTQEENAATLNKNVENGLNKKTLSEEKQAKSTYKNNNSKPFNDFNDEEKPQIYQLKEEKTPELQISNSKNLISSKYQIIQPRNPTNPQKINENIAQLKQKMDTFSDSKPNNPRNIEKKAGSLGNFRHFNQIAELSDNKPSPFPYLPPPFEASEEKTKGNVAMDLSKKFNTEAQENSQFSSIWFNPKPNSAKILNRFNEHSSKKIINNSEIEEKNEKKVNLHSILKNSSRYLKDKSLDPSEIPPVSSAAKNRLYNWLVSIDLLKENLPGIIEKLPKICRNGVIFADIISRMEPRGENIKGISRKPKKPAEIHGNFMKIFDFVSKFEKMNKRFLYHFEPFLDANDAAFWGFLDDIWHMYHLKVSSSDVRFKDAKEAAERSMMILEKSMKINKESDKSKKGGLNESYNRKIFNSLKKSEVSNASYEEICHFGNKNPAEKLQSYETRAWTLPQKNEEPSEKTQSQEKMNIDQNKGKIKKKPRNDQYKEEALEWLKSLGFYSYFSRFSSQNPFENPLKNGVILSQVLSRLHLAKININKVPETALECQHNLEIISQAFRKLPLTLSPEFSRKIPEITNEEALIYEILVKLKEISEKTSKKSLTNTSRLSVKSLTSSPLQRSLSHNESSRFFLKINPEIEGLETKIFNWLKEKGVLEPSVNEFTDVFPGLSNGVLFCDLAEKLCGEGLVGVTRKPINEKTKKYNLQKAMDLLKEKKVLSLQGWSLAPEEIYKGNYVFIMEVLEALYIQDKGKFGDFLSNREEKKEEKKEEIKKNSELISKTGILKGKTMKKVDSEERISQKRIFLTTKEAINLEEEVQNERNHGLNQKKVLEIWFKKLGFVGIIETLDPDQKIWPEFKDGVIFCKLIERLENKELLGVNYKPRSSAASKANIKRVLEVLQLKKDMSLKYLYDEDSLYEGMAANVMEFLLHIKHAYRLTFKYFAKK